MTPRDVPEHVLLTAVVFDDLRLVYVPVPKAASTTILRALSEVAGLRSEDLMRSRKLEVTRGLTVHDGTMWSSAHRLKGRSATELETILQSDDWFTFTVVREPFRRVWSAWVSKVLVRDPRFVLMFGEDWFPAAPSTAKDVVESFRRFVGVLPDRADWSDSHWSAQADLTGVTNIAYNHVGRVERLDRTAADVSEYMGSQGATLPSLGVENPSFLPFSPGLFDRAAHAACVRWTARDCEAFGYEPLPYAADEPDDRWYAAVEASITAIRTVIERNERFLDLWHLLADQDSAQRGAGAHFAHRARFTRGTAATARTRRTGSARAALGVGAVSVALSLLLVLLPEALGDWPYNPIGH